MGIFDRSKGKELTKYYNEFQKLTNEEIELIKEELGEEFKEQISYPSSCGMQYKIKVILNE